MICTFGFPDQLLITAATLYPLLTFIVGGKVVVNEDPRPTGECDFCGRRHRLTEGACTYCHNKYVFKEENYDQNAERSYANRHRCEERS